MEAPALHRLRTTAKALIGTATDLREGLARDAFRDSLATELGLAPAAVRLILPWLVRTRAEGEWTLVRAVDELADERPGALALEMGDERLSWSDLRDQSTRIARVLEGAGVRHGDVVALFGNNSPRYLAIVLACSRLGATAALVNSKIEGAPLAHALLSSKARVVVAEADLADAVRAREDVTSRMDRLFVFGQGAKGPDDLDALAARERSLPPLRARVTSGSDFVYIYTSGTTGLPKPCRVSHAKAVLTGVLMGNLVWSFRPSDKLYCVLPLYHSSAMLLGFGPCVMTGTPVALRSSFSARAFWPDVRRTRATAMLYIGELCRYLLGTKEVPEERDNTLRIAVGNGLRADLWEAFQTRFGITDIREFYGATEAPGAVFNFTNRVGSVGRLPMRRLLPIKLVRYDVASDTHPRGPDGLCIECGPGEVGEMVVVLKDNPLSAISEFRGYTDDEATQKKILRDVMAPGDRCYRSGDLMRFDEDDYFYFVDRIGDTFRFKGENVSTAEVAQVVGQAPGIQGVAVTGVALPGVEGRAGLASVVCEGAFDAAGFHRTAMELPDYAQPRVVRVVHGLATTATFKIQKARLDEPVEPERGEYYVLLGGAYVRLDRALWERIQAGEVRM